MTEHPLVTDDMVGAAFVAFVSRKPDFGFTKADLRRALTTAAPLLCAAQRERDARIAQEIGSQTDQMVGDLIAEAIRAGDAS